jgi:hypothetical protein
MTVRTAAVVLWFFSSVVPTPVSAFDSSPSEDTTLFVYPSNDGFLHQTGHHTLQGWGAMYRIHTPGYFIAGQQTGGETLAAGTYRYSFPFSLMPGQLGGLLHNADDVVRVEAWDATRHECLVSRTFQLCDFLPVSRRYTVKTLTFSTRGREGHHFEPRVYWQGLSGVFLRRVVLERLRDVDPEVLRQKADRFEAMMAERFLERGFVVGRRLNGKIEDVGDAAVWTGIYAVTEGWRYKATRSPEALDRMENALAALHQLYVQAPIQGILVRYVYPDGTVHPQAASKDTYTGFFFAAANCLPLIRDPALKAQLLADVDGLAAHFLDHGLAFIPPKGAAVELSPSLTSSKLTEALEALQYDAGDRQRTIQVLRAVNFSFLMHGQRPWPELPNMIRHLKREEFAAVHREIFPFLNGALNGLRQLQKNVHRSAILWRWEDAPYQKVDRLLLQMLEQLELPENQPLQRVDDLRFLASQSLHALHFLKVAGQVLPRPNRYERYYRDDLKQRKSLLRTAREWYTMDEDLVAAVTGDAQAAAERTSSAHLSFIALFDLVTQEKDRAVRKEYQSLFERQYRQFQSDYNALAHAMQPVIGTQPDQSSMALWSLMLYAEDRQGRGEAYWKKHHRERVRLYGGEVSGKARDPLPVDELQRDPFIWQRSARSLRGDDRNQLYPPLDYLFVYWLARSTHQIN